MKKIFVTLLALTVLLSLAVPALADTESVQTGVNVTTVADGKPIVKCKWEQDLTGSLEDGDPGHITPGSQFLPPMVYGGVKTVVYYAVVTHSQGMGQIEQVTVDIYHPNEDPCDGSFKYELIMQEIDCLDGRAALGIADSYGLVTYNEDYTFTEVDFELSECSARVFRVQENLTYHQPGGMYRVIANAFDGNIWASQVMDDTTPDPQSVENFFEYVKMDGVELDFSGIDYGDVKAGPDASNYKQIDGDIVFDAMAIANGQTKKATVRNIGNTAVRLTVMQTDMNFGYNGTPSNKDWNVKFFARMGNAAQGYSMQSYDPEQTITLSKILCLCHTDKLDFGIHVEKDPPEVIAEHIGTLTVGTERASAYDCPCPPIG